MGKLSKLVAGTAGLATVGTIGAEVVLYLLSNRNGNVDFLWSGEESEHNKLIRLRREDDYYWLLSQELDHYYITSRDGLKLHASLLKSKEPSDRYIFAVHGYRCNGNKEFDSIARFYHENNINVFMIDHRASGESEGKYITYGAKESEDCMDWLAFMISEFGSDIKIALHGCSMGSATVMLLTGNVLPANVKCAVADCGYSSLKDQLYHNFRQNKMLPQIFYPLYRKVAMLQADFDPDTVTPLQSVERCQIPIIFAHGKSDDFVPYKMVLALNDACSSPDKKLFCVEGAEHVQSFQLSSEFKTAIIENINKYM